MLHTPQYMNSWVLTGIYEFIDSVIAMTILRMRRIDFSCGEGQTQVHACPGNGIPFPRQAAPQWWHEVILREK